MIGTVFESKDYRLEKGCIRRILDDASSSSQQRDKPFLPYLQLLASRFFEWLEERHRQARGYDETIIVGSQDYLEFSGKGRLMDAFFREAILELLLFEPDRHLVLKIFSLLIEGDRRRLVGKQEIRGSFIDQDKIGLMLLELTRRRLVVFDEVRDGYELVHDALVEPLREFLDRQRTDYSKSEFLAIVRRVLAGERVGDQLLENLALFCLRAGVNPEWLEKMALWMVDILKSHQSSQHTFFLYAMLNRSHSAGLLNRPERESLQDIIEAMVFQYKDNESILIDNLRSPPTDTETRLEVLVAMEKASPGCATDEIVGLLGSFSEDAPDLISKALSVFAADCQNEAVRQHCRKICRSAYSDDLTAQAMAILADGPSTPDDTMLCVEAALKRPGLSDYRADT